MKVNPSRIPALTALANKFAANKAIYEEIEKATNVPWEFVAIANERESGGDLTTYLGNGDPLNRVTTHVPAGRGPFASWADGAIDALKYQGLDKWTDWSIEGILYQFECYNGLGYLGKTNSPYVWSWSNLYSSGKYISDGHYSSSAVDQQPGCAPMLWQMIQMGLIAAPAQTPPPQPSDDIKWVQSALNKLGANLAVDGYDGIHTQALIKQFQADHGLAIDGIVGPNTRSALEDAINASVIPDIFGTIIKDLTTPSTTSTTESVPMSWIASIFLNLLGSAQAQSLLRKGLTVVGTALLVKLGMDPATAGGLLSQIITGLGGVVALGSSVYLSAQNASPSITNPVLVTTVTTTTPVTKTTVATPVDPSTKTT